MIKRILKWLIKVLYHATLIGQSTGPHVTRYYPYKYLSQVPLPHSAADRVLSISGSERLAGLMGYAESQVQDASYPEYNALDLAFDDAQFDAVISDQVLEHLEGNPQTAVDESFRVVKQGGIVVHATCFVSPKHWGPKDLWRFSPDALKLMVEPHGEIIDVGGWGNPYIWPYNMLGLRYEPVSNWKWHPVHWLAIKNHPAWPVFTWVIAKKR